MLNLRNPHAVLAALKGRPDDVREVRVPPKGASEAWEAVTREAKRRGVQLRQGQRPQRAPGVAKSGREGSADAVVAERAPVSLRALFSGAGEGRGLWLALDCIQDPRNVGSLFRSAAFFGVRGVLMTQDRSAPLTGVTYDTASGGLEAVPYALETNLRAGLDAAKEAGLWILGSDEEAKRSVEQVDPDRAWLLVLGNEEKGLRRLTRKTCDEICRVSGSGGAVGSLNVSVAGAILMSRLSC